MLVSVAWLAVALVLGRSAAAASSDLDSLSIVTSHGRERPLQDKRERRVGSRAAGILRLGDWYRTSSHYNRYTYVIVGRADASKAASLKAKSFVYQSATDIVPAWTAGVSYGQARKNGWLLKDSAGRYLTSKGYGFYVGDVGDRGYRHAWLKNVSRLLARSRVDGVFIDAVTADVESLTGGFAPAKYPTQRSWENAMASFIAYVGPALRARRFYVLANALKYVSGNNGSNDVSLTAGWWRRIGPNVSGLMTEYFVQNPNNVEQLRAIGTEWYNYWDRWQRLVSVAQQAGADFFGDTHASITNTQAMRYAKASFLLDWDGKGGGLFVDCGCPDPWNKAWTTNIGLPAHAKFQRRRGVWQRKYRLGTVVVNATTSSVKISIKGASYTLAPTDALILSGR